MATKTAVPTFSIGEALVLGRTAYVITDPEGNPVGITFSAKKAQGMLAFRLAPPIVDVTAV